MDRRTFIGRVAGGLLAMPLAARAQKSSIPVVGFLFPGSAAQWTSYVAAFREGLNEVGYIDGKNIAIEFRWAEGQYDRLPALAADLVRRQVAVMVTTGGPRAAQAAKAATSTIPIVFTTGSDPVEYGLVASLGHPGGNATGVTFFTVDLVAKRMELLHELVPKATEIALISNPNNPYADSEVAMVREAARSFGQHLYVLIAGTEQDINAAFATLVQLRAEALIIGSDPFFNARRDQFVALAAKNAVPAIFEVREFVMAGGLLSYGASISETYRKAGIYTGKILNGAKPADLPVLQPTKFELVINLKTAKALGLTISQSLLLRADEVIQ
jgi:putative tryptophan/tyrosine transport system substrate-binding protein